MDPIIEEIVIQDPSFSVSSSLLEILDHAQATTPNNLVIQASKLREEQKKR